MFGQCRQKSSKQPPRRRNTRSAWVVKDSCGKAEDTSRVHYSKLCIVNFSLQGNRFVEQDAALLLTQIFDNVVYVVAEVRQSDSVQVSQYGEKGICKLCTHVLVTFSDVK